MLIAPVVVGTLIVTIILYVANRRLASRVAYYTGLVLMVLTGTAIFGGHDVCRDAARGDPPDCRSRPYIDQAVQKGLSEGLKNVPNLPDIPALKNLLTPTP